MTTLPLIYDFDLPSLSAMLSDWEEPEYRARQLWQGLYRRLWDSPNQFTHLPVSLRQQLVEHFSFSSLRPAAELSSKDGETHKILFLLLDEQSIETVLMRYAQRRTLCISTQVGCGMGCVFCATGQVGFHRHLSSGEIVEQVLYFARKLAAQGERVTNVVVMGMGEPFHNYQATLQAIDRLNHAEGFGFGERRFTISTVGLVPLIRRFANEGRQINLAISLHAADDDLRSSILPINRKYHLDMLMEACRDYVHKTHRRISFEWALIRNVNDSPEQARRLGERLRALRLNESSLSHVNIILLNPTQGYDGKPATQERANAFQTVLKEFGIPCTIRLRRGIDIQAGCGQLAGKQT